MSIENNLKRIADALELLAGTEGRKALEQETVAPAPVAPAPVAPAPVAPAPVAPAPVAPAPVAPAPVAPAAQAPLTPEELNKQLIVEMQRLGGRGPIDEVMTGHFGVNSITQLAAEQYQPLIDAVKLVAVA